MAKMQNVKFGSLDEFLAYLPDEELVLTEFFRNLVLDCLPQCTEKLSFNVPFYKIKRGICFIWPASVIWGSKPTYSGVRFGFQYGYLLTAAEPFLQRDNRKQVLWKDFQKIQSVDVGLMKSFLFEAALIDEEYSKKPPL